MFKQLLCYAAAAALGSAGTYLAMRADTSVSDTRRLEPASAAAATPAPKTTEVKPAGESPRTPARKNEAAATGFLPEEIEGITPAQLNRCRLALLKTLKDEGVQTARAKIVELRKEAEYASDAQKRSLRQDFEEAALDLRQATKAAMLAADESLNAELVDKVLDAREELIKQRAKQAKK
jgi:hypothetical protein